MSYTADQLLVFATNFDKYTSESLVKSAKKKDEKKSKKPSKGKFPDFLKKKKEDSNSAKDSKTSKDSKKSDKKDKKKKSAYYSALINKFSQTTTWNQAEQSDEDAKNFMANPAPAAPVDKTYSPSPQKLDTDLITNLQKFLLSKKYNLGPTGADGKFGNFTTQALKAWQKSVGLPDSGKTDEATMKALTPLMQAQGLLPKTDAPGAKFDHKMTNDTLNAISALFTQMQSQSAQGQIKPANAQQYIQTLAPYEARLNEVRTQLAALNVDPNMTPEQAGLLKGLYPKAEKLATDLAAWKEYLGKIPKPMVDEKPYGNAPAAPPPAQSNAPTPTTQT